MANISSTFLNQCTIIFLNFLFIIILLSNFLSFNSAKIPDSGLAELKLKKHQGDMKNDKSNTAIASLALNENIKIDFNKSKNFQIIATKHTDIAVKP